MINAHRRLLFAVPHKAGFCPPYPRMIPTAVQLPETRKWREFRALSKNEMAGFYVNRCHPSNAPKISNNKRNNDNNSNKLVITPIFQYTYITDGGQNMARRQAIAPDELFETANRLKAEGKEVTALALLDALGGGSLSTIYKHLEVWQASKPVEVITPGDELPPQVLASFTASWRLATQEAGRQVIEVKEKAKEEVAAALRQFHGALDAIRKLEQESEADAQEIERLTEKLEKTETALQDLQKEAAGHKSQVEQLQKLMEKLEKTIEGLRQEAAKAAELKGTVATLQAQNDKLMDRLPKSK